MEKIGFMGLGIMGGAMAANIRKAGYPLIVYNRSPEKAAHLEALGAEVAASPRSLARQADIIVMMVTGPEALEELLWGLEGASRSLEPGKMLINMSSVAPRYTREVARRLAPLGAAFIDAPVSGTKKPAEDGSLIILAGGDEEHVERVRPLLLTMGKKVVYCGPVGQGSLMKMAINLLLGTMMEGLAEMLTFGRQGGLDGDTMLDVVLSGPLGCGLYQMKADMLRTGTYPVNFPLKHMTKDLKFIVDTAYELGAPTPAAHAILQVFRQGVAQGAGDRDFAAVVQVLEKLAAGQ